MDDKSNNNVSILGELDRTFFSKHWPVWVGGMLLGLLNVFLFMIKSPWGGSGGYNNWGENLYQALGFNIENVTSTPESLYGMLNILIILGALVGALLSREFALRIPSVGELIKGFIGGGLMAIGARLGIGCTIGGFFSGIPALSGGAILLTVGLFMGTLVALKYIIWEMEALPGISAGKGKTLLAAKKGGGAWQKWLGLVVTIAVFVMAYFYSEDNKTMSWFVIIGLMMGMICQRSRFCIVASFRDPFMTGKSSSTVGIIVGLLVGLVGFTVIKMFGIGAGDLPLRYRELTWVFPHFWLRGIIGGFIFGFGMTIAGGCAVGTLWRCGEGQVKLWAAAVGFLLISPVTKIFIEPGFVSLLPHSTRFRNFLPDYIGYAFSFVLVLAILLIWYLFVKWNERTGKFSAY